jgi:GH25 family lysozyme M1 (1,4-beta-N-acetylmuramidase)
MRARGVDLSSVQGLVGFNALAQAGFDFAIVKGTEGASGIDSHCLHNVEAARTAGMLVAGVYHVLTPGSPIMAQVSNALQLARAHKAPIMLDFELPWPMAPSEAAGHLARAVSFLDCIEETARLCPIYSFPAYLETLPFGDTLLQLVDRPLWIARYPEDEHHWPAEDWQPALPNPWTEWLFCQWSGDGGLPAPGIPAVVDHDIFNGDRAALAAWLAG